MSETEIFKKEVDERGQGMYAGMGSERDGLRREKILEGGELCVRASGKVLFCHVEVGKEGVFAITEKTWLTGWGEEMPERREMEER